jgi:hypothetical protein
MFNGVFRKTSQLSDLRPLLLPLLWKPYFRLEKAWNMSKDGARNKWMDGWMNVVNIRKFLTCCLRPWENIASVTVVSDPVNLTLLPLHGKRNTGGDS